MRFRSFVHEILTSCHPRQWTLKTRLLYLPAFLIILFVILLLFYLNQAFTVQTRHSARSQLSLLSQWIINDIDEHKKNLLTESLLTADNPDISAAFAGEDREKLNRLLLPNIKTTLKHPGYYQKLFYHFYQPPAVSFYQNSQTGHWGKDLSESKPMVVQVNQELQSYSGLERDDKGISVIAVSPIFFHDKHVGAVEVRMSLKNTLENIEIAVPFGLMVVADSGKDTPVTEHGQELDRMKILLSRGHIKSEMISQGLSFLSDSSQTGRFLYKTIELDGVNNSSPT